MRKLSSTIALLVSVTLLGSGASVAAQPSATQHFATQHFAQAKKQSVLELRVRNAAEVQRSFGFAARQPGAQAIEISCSPGDSEHCSGDFVTACDDHDGGMSTNPDGSVTCSLPQHD